MFFMTAQVGSVFSAWSLLRSDPLSFFMLLSFPFYFVEHCTGAGLGLFLIFLILEQLAWE